MATQEVTSPIILDDTGNRIAAAIEALGGGTKWGDITGSIADQADLKAKLNVSKSATVAASEWTAAKTATCAIAGLKLSSDPSQKAVCGFTDTDIEESADPRFRCDAEGVLTIKCKGAVPTASITVVCFMCEAVS